MRSATNQVELKALYATLTLRAGAVALGTALLATACKDHETTTRPTGTAATPRASAVADPADWCAQHALPESMCTKCNAGLVGRFQSSGDWCAEHGYPESVCPFCSPMQPPGAGTATSQGDGARVADPADWCAQHALPESMCTKCNAGLVERFQSSGDWCAEHGYPESVCPFCNPMQPPAGVPPPSAIAPGTRVRFRSPAIERAAGIETVPATRGAMGICVDATARIEFNRNSMADVRSAVPGIVREVFVDLGQQVEPGDTLFTLESAQVGDLQARRRASHARVESAQANLARQQELREGAIASQRQVELARQELAAAEAELRSIDQSLRISGAARSGRTGRFAVQAPMAGWVVRRPALVGTFAGEPDSLATIADISVMWVLLDIPEWDAASVRVGQQF